jgi:hypothetical protein
MDLFLGRFLGAVLQCNIHLVAGPSSAANWLAWDE